MESCPGTLLHAVPTGSYDPGAEVIVSFPGARVAKNAHPGCLMNYRNL